MHAEQRFLRWKEERRNLQEQSRSLWQFVPVLQPLAPLSNNVFMGQCVEMDSGKALGVYF